MQTPFVAAGFTLLACLLLPVKHASAAPKRYDVGRSPFILDVPTGWQAAPGLYGLPIVFLAPKQNGTSRRPTVTVIPSGWKNFIYLDPESMKNDQDGYRKGREKWLQKVHGRSIQYYPYKFEHWPKAEEVHSIGYKYALGDNISQIERSYYVVCKKKLFLIKTLIADSLESKFSPVTAAILRSFECE